MKTKKDLLIPFSWEERRPVFLERFFYIPKKYEEHAKIERLDWETLFGNDRPVYLELCSGNGQWIGEKAKAHPEVNWAAVEFRFDRARKIWLKAFRESIPNLYVICGEAATFLQWYAAKASVTQAFVNFPDPWPKLRHAKHRLIQAPFLEELAEVVQGGGRATFATDDEPYRDQMVRELSLVSSWKPVFDTPYYRSDWASYGDSFFASLWKGKGRNLYYMQYENGT
jgi:tRNA (guanine-N7-)-methyltransferase